ncbi:MAG TPA: DEAD/DEAH box helicase [Thermoanaerobaculia bacterium]|jgi:superfamily II DNA or RNA helicase
MPLPDRYRSAFSPSTLKTIAAHGASFRVEAPLFFRGAYTANVTEHERRTMQPVIVLDAARVVSWRCGCNPAMRANDLCRHIAVLLDVVGDADGRMPAERFDASVWRAVGFASFSEGHTIEANGVDPREALLRKYALTEQEHELLRRGSGSMRLQFETSPWYRWSKSMFLDAADARLELSDGAFRLHARGEVVPLPASAIEHVLATAPEVVTASGFELAPLALEPSLRIEITRARTLRFSPVLLGSGGALYERRALPQFGRWFLTGNRFASAAPAAPMFVERADAPQASLFEVRASGGVPHDRETVIAEDDVFAFVERHRDELARMPEALAPESIRGAHPVRLDDEVVFDFATPESSLLEVTISFRAGGEWIAAPEIARARRDGVRALIRGNVWIDVTDPQFAWLDEATLGPAGQVLVTKLELLRIRGSLRGRAVFRGDLACERIFRMFDEPQTSSGAPETALDLYSYQQTGYQWLWHLQQNGFGALLCDDMGLGKTHQAIALIAALTSGGGGSSAPRVLGSSGDNTARAPEEPRSRGPEEPPSILVVSPTSVLDHWRDKLARYAPGADVTLTSYGIVRSRIEQFRGRRFDLVVLDEMQTIKNADTATHHALRAIDKRIAVGLTGTPIENHEGELKALLDFVVPGYLPKHVDDRATLQRLVRPFVLRRTKQQVLTELPPKIVDKRWCELTGEQRALYRRVLEARAKPLRAQLRSGAHVSYVHIFAALNYLKQICNHPASAGGGFGGEAGSGKWDTFVELLDECMSSGLKVVVFSQYLPMLSLIEEHLFRNDIGYASIKGATRARGEEVARFRDDPDCRVFTASLRAGGLGIDLTSASVVIHYDRWWNQAREDQATDRVHRLGQSKGVQVIKLVTRGTIEEKIDALIERKALLAADLIRPDDPALVKQFTADELDELLAG